MTTNSDDSIVILKIPSQSPASASFSTIEEFIDNVKGNPKWDYKYWLEVYGLEDGECTPEECSDEHLSLEKKLQIAEHIFGDDLHACYIFFSKNECKNFIKKYEGHQKFAAIKAVNSVMKYID